VIPNLLAGLTRDPAECVVKINDAPIEALYPLLAEVTVETGRNAPDTATLTFESRRDERGEWLVQDATGLFDDTPLMREWNRISIAAVFGGREEEVLRGFIRQIRAEYPEDAGAARLVVECQDESLQLDRQHRRKSWGTEQIPSSDMLILSETLGQYSGLSPDKMSATGQTRIVGLNQDGTDIQLLQARAEENGYELYFRRGLVYFGPPRAGLPLPQPTLSVYAGRTGNCISINATADAHQPDAVAFDLPAESGEGSSEVIVEPDLPVMGNERAGNPEAGLPAFVWRMSGAAGTSEVVLRAKALQRANEADLHKIQAEGELDGTLYGHVLLPGLPVGVDGVGSRLAGLYYVDGVTHTFNAGGYRQRFRLLRNAWGDNLDTLPGAGPLAAVMGGIDLSFGVGVGL
jgi:phage protein D